MKNKLWLSVICSIYLMFNTLQINAQETPKTNWADKFFYGGNLGLQFGNTTYIDVSPLVGYKITEKIHTGIGATYIYLNSKLLIQNSIYRYETSMYGSRVFGRYYPLEYVFGHVEYEYLNLGFPTEITTGSNRFKIERQNVTSIFVGGGYAQSIGSSSSLVLMLLWNLNEGIYSPYQNPIIRIGFNAGF